MAEQGEGQVGHIFYSFLIPKQIDSFPSTLCRGRDSKQQQMAFYENMLFKSFWYIKQKS